MGNFGENTGKVGRPPRDYSSNLAKEPVDTPVDEGYSFGNTRLVKNKSGLDIIHPVYHQIGSFDKPSGITFSNLLKNRSNLY